MKDGRFHGYGVEILVDNGRYEGNYSKGCFDGIGTYWSGDFKYIGEFKNNNKHGHGVNIWTDGTKYDG